MPSGREAQRIIAVSVGSGPDHRVLHEHGHAHHRLAGLEIADIAGHRDPVRRLARGVADLVDLVLGGSLLLLPARHQGDTGAFLVAIALSPLLPQEEVLGQGGHQGVISQYKEGAAIRGYLEGSPLQRTPQRHQGLFLLTVYANDHGIRLQGLPIDRLAGLPLDSVEHDIQGYLPEIQIDRPLRPHRPAGQQAHHHNDIQALFHGISFNCSYCLTTATMASSGACLKSSFRRLIYRASSFFLDLRTFNTEPLLLTV